MWSIKRVSGVYIGEGKMRWANDSGVRGLRSLAVGLEVNDSGDSLNRLVLFLGNFRRDWWIDWNGFLKFGGLWEYGCNRRTTRSQRKKTWQLAFLWAGPERIWPSGLTWSYFKAVILFWVHKSGHLGCNR